MRLKFKWHRLANQFTIVIGAFSFLAFISFIVYHHYEELEADIEVYQEQLVHIGKTSRIFLESEEIKYLNRNFPDFEQISSNHQDEVYEKLYNQLLNIQTKNDLVTPIYLLVPSKEWWSVIRSNPDTLLEGGTQFLVTSNKDPYFRHRYLWKSEMQNAWFHKEVVKVQPYKVKENLWTSVYIPIVDKVNNQSIAILAIDKNMDELLSQRFEGLKIEVLSFLGLWLLILLIIGYIAHRLTRPLAQLMEAAEYFKEGDLTSPIQINSKSEIARLGNILDEARVNMGKAATNQQQFIDELILAKNEAQEAALSKSLFLSTMSHEIRTPLNGIISMKDLLLQSKINEEQKDMLETLGTSSNHLLLLVNDILDFSSIDSGKLTLSNTPTNLRKLFENSVKSQSEIARDKGLKLFLDIPTTSDLRYILDENRMGQILINLISNAVKFTEEGQIRVGLRIEESFQLSEKQVDQLLIEIEDTGPGIPQNKISSIFNPFSQVKNSIRREKGGTGLGISICDGLLNLMDTRLEVDSHPGRGSRFYFHILLTKVTSKLSEETPLEQENNMFGGVRILIAEDNLINIKVMKKVLSKLSIEAEFVINGQDLVDTLHRNQNFDLIISDIHMPKMDGCEAAEKIRTMGIDIPLWALTADVVEETKTRVFQSGFDGILHKPFKPNEIKDLLIQLSQNHETQWSN